MIRTLLTQLCDIAALLSGPDHPFGGEELPAPAVSA